MLYRYVSCKDIVSDLFTLFCHALIASGNEEQGHREHLRHFFGGGAHQFKAFFIRLKGAIHNKKGTFCHRCELGPSFLCLSLTLMKCNLNAK